MKIDTTFVSPWRCKKCQKRHLAPSNLTFLLIAIDRNERRKADLDLQKLASIFFNFCYRTLSYGLSKFSDDFTPFFRL